MRRLDEPTTTSCPAGDTCPAIVELDDDTIVIIGSIVTIDLELPDGVGIGEGEQAIRIPRHTLISAKPNIPER